VANQLASLPWVIDTASANVLFTGKIFVRHFEFAGYAAGTDTVVVQDINSRPVWQADGKTDLDPVLSYKVGWIKGIKVPTLSSGKLYVYIK